MTAIKESDLYAPISDYLTRLGYSVKGEVKNCDLTATLGDELVVVELKRNFTLELIYQAIDRQQLADLVYMAVPLPKDGYQKKYRNMAKLCKRLGLGLILVGFSTQGQAMVDVAVQPEAVKVRKSNKKRSAVLTEHQSRTGSYNIGGVNRRKILTAYKEKTLLLAQLLWQHGPLTATQLRELGGDSKTASMLRSNFYGWFEACADKTFCITDQGVAALEQYRDLLQPQQAPHQTNEGK